MIRTFAVCYNIEKPTRANTEHPFDRTSFLPDSSLRGYFPMRQREYASKSIATVSYVEVTCATSAERNVSVRFVPMPEEMYASYLQTTTALYARDKIHAGIWGADEAIELAVQEYQKLLPQGVHTPNQYLYALLDETVDTLVGALWFEILDTRTGQMAYINDFLIFEPYRRRSYGRQALIALDGHIRQLGIKKIGLHVFGHNSPARSLYKQCGYQTTNLYMAKRLDE